VFEQQHILNKIEEWAERLPYKTLKIEIQLPDQTLTLEKEKTRSIGFSVPPPDMGTTKQKRRCSR
jgi:hypothetical protein